MCETNATTTATAPKTPAVKKVNPYLNHPERNPDEIYLGTLSIDDHFNCRWVSVRPGKMTEEKTLPTFAKKSEIKDALYDKEGRERFNADYTAAVLSAE